MMTIVPCQLPIDCRCIPLVYKETQWPDVLVPYRHLVIINRLAMNDVDWHLVYAPIFYHLDQHTLEMVNCHMDNCARYVA